MGMLHLQWLEEIGVRPGSKRLLRDFGHDGGEQVIAVLE